MLADCIMNTVVLLNGSLDTVFSRDRVRQSMPCMAGCISCPLKSGMRERDKVVEALQAYRIAQIGCNHCTGIRAVEKMIAAGLPVIRGTARHGSKTDLFLGNGDVLEL